MSYTVHMHVVVVIVNVEAFGNQSTLVLSYLIIILIALKTCEETCESLVQSDADTLCVCVRPLQAAECV